MSAAEQLLRCPIDGALFGRSVGGGLSCAEGHRFEARDGVVDFGPPSPRFNFERWAPVYDVLFPWLVLRRLFGVSSRDLVRLHERALEAARGGAVLDAACGSGLFSLPAVHRAGAAAFVGVDLARRMLAEARRRAGRLRVEALLVRGDACDLPLRGGVIDVAIMSLGLQFVPERGRCLAELRRVLRVGGRFFGAAPALGLWPRYDRRHARRARKDFPLDRDRFAGELAAAGFREVRLEARGALLVWEATAAEGGAVVPP